MICLECLEVVFIRVRLKGYLKNKTENETTLFNEKGIMNKNKITYAVDNTKYTIKIEKNRITLIRESNDFANCFVFDEKLSSCNYLLKENNYNLDIDINTRDKSIYVLYEIIDSGLIYEFKMEMSDVL